MLNDDKISRNLDEEAFLYTQSGICVPLKRLRWLRMVSKLSLRSLAFGGFAPLFKSLADYLRQSENKQLVIGGPGQTTSPFLRHYKFTIPVLRPQ
jgi:hypothetical protein